MHILLHIFFNFHDISFVPFTLNFHRDIKHHSKEIFDKIVSKNDNVKMILCGHCLYPDFIAVDYVKNSAGKEVPCIMVNYQHDTDGGRGNIGLLAYKGDDFTLYSYSTTEGNMKGRKIATIKID